ncbi:DUF7660 family protein [Gottfriedia acidiceleris]|uniref:DUF7660 family protein n=1 Tax=Gottfriedia acidiceleris TaxID=371036 RepID=UPI00101B80BD|nr:hypothetical protein [Gottfriedia acidiceleris]
MKFNDIEKKVKSKKELIKFLEIMKQDNIDNQLEWESTNIVSFLDAMQRWAPDTDLISEEPKWSEFAKIIYAGSRYE